MDERKDDLGTDDLDSRLGASVKESRILVAAIHGVPADRVRDWVVIAHVADATDEHWDHILTTNTGNVTILHMISQALHGVWEEMTEE
jgi:hypothetical protein